jgi:hypothetical protein
VLTTSRHIPSSPRARPSRRIPSPPRGENIRGQMVGEQNYKLLCKIVKADSKKFNQKLQRQEGVRQGDVSLYIYKVLFSKVYSVFVDVLLNTTHKCARTHPHARTHARTHASTHTHTHTHTPNQYTQTQTHTHTHTHTRFQQGSACARVRSRRELKKR